MAEEQPSSEVVSRTQIGFLGLDIIAIHTSSAIRTALSSGDMGRLTDVINDPSDLPFIFRWFFPLSRFYSRAHGFFLAFRAASYPSYAPCRAFLDSKFAPGTDVSAHVQRAADILEGKEGNISDTELSRVFVRALAGRFFTSGEVEEEVILAAEKQVGGLGDAFVPWKFIPAISALKEVYNAFEKALRDTGYVQELPREATTDVAHSVFASNLHGAAILRELAKGTGDEDVREVIARLGRVESSLRMPIRNSSLGGLLKADNPAVTGRSIVRLMIGDVARESADVAWAFGQGDEIRRCAAEPAIIEFCTEVQKEFRRRKEE